MNVHSFASVGAPADFRQTIALPSHQPGDLIILWIHSLGNETKPTAGGTVPSWTKQSAGSGTISSHVLSFYWAIATASNHTSGNWGTNTRYISCVVLRPTGSALSIGAGQGWPVPTSSYIAYPALTFQALDGTSWGMRAAIRGSTVTPAISTPPSGWTNLLVNPPSPNCFHCVHIRPNIISNPVLENVEVGGSQIHVSSTMEIKEAGPFLTSAPLMAIV